LKLLPEQRYGVNGGGAMSGSTGLMEVPIDDLVGLMQAGDVSSLELVELCLERIERLDQSGPVLNSIVTVNPEALGEAAERDARLGGGDSLGPLHGIPVVVKDQLETAGLRTTFGSSGFADYVPRRDATVIARLRDAGAVILAKTAMSDFATSWFGFSSLSGVTRNAYSQERDPGGSSSGTGAAVGARLGVVGIGEDTGGSIRVPASFNGLVGVRVTTGLVSRDGMSPLVVFQDTAGPMAKWVSDAARVLDAIVGFDPRDPFTAACVNDRRASGYREGLGRSDLSRLRVGVLREAFGSNEDAASTAANETLSRALDVLSNLGATLIDPVNVEDLERFVEETTLYFVRSRYDINEFLRARPDAPFHSIEDLHTAGHFHPLISLFQEIVAGPAHPEEDAAYYRKVAAREEFQRAILNTFARNQLDVLVYPTVRIPAPLRSDVDVWSASASSATLFPTNTVIASHASLPAVSVPAGLTADGLPVGLEIVGRPYDEQLLLDVAHGIEQTIHPPPPKIAQA
jgi:Asp-tRNA(Asn)/Glu-tRNA(Gln) amidotransferase A subunit family amidase